MSDNKFQGNSKVSEFARLIFLASELHLALPSAIINNVPQGDLIAAVASEGIRGASSSYDVVPEQLEHLRSQGSNLGPASEREFRALLSKHATVNLEDRRSGIHISKYMAMVGQISQFYFMDEDVLIDTQTVSLDKLHEQDLEGIAKWKTGFEPFDILTGGFYQGITIITGKTGHGKTTAMLAIMKYLRETGNVGEQLFFETEIPMLMMLYKLRRVNKGLFTDNDLLKTGSFNVDGILDYCRKNPDPDRVVYIDSPDVLAGGTGEGKRFYLESIYRKLVTLKNISKHVVVASQAKQKDREIVLESNSEAWAKAHYTDIMIGWQRVEVLADGFSRIKSNIPKNRFGIPDQKLFFDFNYTTFEYRMVEGSDDDIITTNEEEEDEW